MPKEKQLLPDNDKNGQKFVQQPIRSEETHNPVFTLIAC